MKTQNLKNYPKFLFKIEDLKHETRFNSRQFGPYEDKKTGKTKYLINGDGRVIESGYITSRPTQLFDVKFIQNAEIVRYLMGHPENVANGGSGFSLIDINEAAKSKDTHLLKELELESRVMTLSTRKLRALSAALNLNYNSDKKVLQANVVRRIRTEQINGGKSTPGYISVEKLIDSKKTLLTLDISQMLEYGIIKINESGIYYNGNNNMGLNMDQVSLYLEKNNQLYGLLKKTLRERLDAEGKLDVEQENVDLTFE